MVLHQDEEAKLYQSTQSLLLSFCRVYRFRDLLTVRQFLHPMLNTEQRSTVKNSIGLHSMSYCYNTEKCGLHPYLPCSCLTHIPFQLICGTIPLLDRGKLQQEREGGKDKVTCYFKLQEKDQLKKKKVTYN